MADETSANTLPPPPSTAGAPGLTDPNMPPTNGSANPSHMPPPPLQPVVIPQNNNPIPTAVTSPFSGSAMTPSSAGGNVRRAAPEPNKRALYVGGLDPKVGEDLLRQIFETTGHVQSVKIIPDKHNKGTNYGFVEYDDPGAAEAAMTQLNSRKILNSEIRVNWAYQSNNTSREDTSNHFHIFVGDLSNEVNDEVLLQAFSAFGTISEARVMWDMKTGRSRGYGFVAYRERGDAEKALASMDGEWLGSRAIRCNWANQKGQPSMTQQVALTAMGMSPAGPGGGGFPGGPGGPGMGPGGPGGPPGGPGPGMAGHHQYPTQGVQSYDMIVAQTPVWQTTCYVGNLTPYTTQNDVVPLFQNFGFVHEARFQSDRGFAFIRMDSHENAAMAICQLSGYNVNGRPLKCSWGKDRPTGGAGGQYPETPTQAGPGPSPGYGPPGSAGGYGYPSGPYSAGPYSAGPLSPQGAPLTPHGAPLTPQHAGGPGGPMAPHHGPMPSQGGGGPGPSGAMSPQQGGPPQGYGPGPHGHQQPAHSPRGGGYGPQSGYGPPQGYPQQGGYGMPGGGAGYGGEQGGWGGQGAGGYGPPRGGGPQAGQYPQY